MRDPDLPAFAASRALHAALGDWAQVPHAAPPTQLIWATYIRSRRTFEAIGLLLGHEHDTQAAMLCRPLFEDMLVAHWIDYNRGDADWLVERFFGHRDAIALDQFEMIERDGWPMGPSLVPDPADLRSRQNQLGREFKGRARGDWWDPGSRGRGNGSPIGIGGLAAILEDVANRRERFDPRFAGGEEPLLRRFEAIVVKWFSRQLHHTAIGLPFQPHASGPIRLEPDPNAFWRIAFSAYWIFGQQCYLLLEHLQRDSSAFDQIFVHGLVAIGSEVAPEAVEAKPPVPYAS